MPVALVVAALDDDDDATDETEDEFVLVAVTDEDRADEEEVNGSVKDPEAEAGKEREVLVTACAQKPSTMDSSEGLSALEHCEETQATICCSNVVELAGEQAEGASA